MSVFNSHPPRPVYMYYMYVYTHTHTHTHIYGFLVCRYARSPGLAARQNTPAIEGAFYRPNGTSYQLQPSFHTQSTEPEPTARARRSRGSCGWLRLRPKKKRVYTCRPAMYFFFWTARNRVFAGGVPRRPLRYHPTTRLLGAFGPASTSPRGHLFGSAGRRGGRRRL